MQAHYRAEAHKEWDQARQKAFWNRLLAGLSGKKTHLLDFNVVSHSLHLDHAIYRGIQTIPMDKIVGSVDRYEDFTAAFLPLNRSLQERWEDVAARYLDPMSGGVNPIEVYKIGDSYFVKDGNHRVSVARHMGTSSIEAYVWEMTGLLTEKHPDADIQTLLLETEREKFLTQTNLPILRPEHTVQLTKPGSYIDLLRQIAHYQQVLEQIDGGPVPYEEAVTAWYDLLYETTIDLILEGNVLQHFPGRTPADLFVWILRRREELEQRFGQHVSVKEALDLTARPRLGRVRGIWRRLRQAPRLKPWGRR